MLSCVVVLTNKIIIIPWPDQLPSKQATLRNKSASTRGKDYYYYYYWYCQDRSFIIRISSWSLDCSGSCQLLLPITSNRRTCVWQSDSRIRCIDKNAIVQQSSINLRNNNFIKWLPQWVRVRRTIEGRKTKCMWLCVRERKVYPDILPSQCACVRFRIESQQSHFHRYNFNSIYCVGNVNRLLL